MSARGRATMSVLAWIVGWILLTAALAGMLRTAWPALPLWVVPAASTGVALLMIVGLKEVGKFGWFGARKLIEEGQKKLRSEKA